MTKAEPERGVATVYVSSFSGMILHSPGEYATVRVNRPPFILDVMPPYRIAKPTWRPTPQFTLESLDRIFPGVPGNLPLITAAIIPHLDDAGKPALKAVWSDDVDDATLPLDTISIVVRGSDHSNSGQNVFLSVLTEIQEWLRELTNQWWIGRPSEGLTGGLHTALRLAAGDKIVDFPEGLSSQTTPGEDTLRLTPEIWFSAALNVRNGLSITPQQRLLSLSSYHYFTKSYDVAILMACSLFEIQRDLVIQTKGARISDVPGSPTDILKHVNVGFERLFGRNLERKHPDLNSFLRSCWAARGRIAHGKSLLWMRDGKGREMQSTPSDKFTEQVGRLSAWFDAIIVSGANAPAPAPR